MGGIRELYTLEECEYLQSEFGGETMMAEGKLCETAGVGESRIRVISR
jgi:hypothetical protein